jgi:hypothetical protein
MFVFKHLQICKYLGVWSDGGDFYGTGNPKKSVGKSWFGKKAFKNFCKGDLGKIDV